MSNISTQNALTLQTMNLGSMSLDVVQIGDEPWFYAPSLARTLEYETAVQMLRGIPDDERGLHPVHTPGGIQHANFLTESGFYRVVFRSRSECAEPFKRWVTREVLPSIRKTGQYKLHQEAKRMLQQRGDHAHAGLQHPDGDHRQKADRKAQGAGLPPPGDRTPREAA